MPDFTTIVNTLNQINQAINTVNNSLNNLFNGNSSGLINEVDGGNIASASTVNIEDVTGNLLTITGNTTINEFILGDGHRRVVKFTGTPLIVNSSTLVLPGNADITVNVGDRAEFWGVGGGIVFCFYYTRANGLTLNGLGTQLANNVAITGGFITGMPTPTLNSDVAIKSYVDTFASGLIALGSSLVATTGTNLMSAYNNGTLGVGATLTNTDTQAALVIDTITLSVNDIVLVKDQTNPEENGVYSVTDTGSVSTDWILTRVTYFDEASEIIQGSWTGIILGAVNALTSWIDISVSPLVVGTDPIIFNNFNPPFLQVAENLADLANVVTARSNLGLGTAAVENVSAFLQPANNLSDVSNAATARTNLGLGSAAVQNTGFFLQSASNLSDVGSASASRTNLGLGTIATQDANAVNITGGIISALLNEVDGGNVPSATTLDLESATGNIVTVDGTATVSAITLGDGHRRVVVFTGAPTLVNSANLILPGLVDILCVAGDSAEFWGFPGSVVQCTYYTRINTSSGGVINEVNGGDISSASTIDLENVSGNLLTVSGNDIIDTITLGNGHRRVVEFTDNCTLVNSANLVLPGALDILTAVGDTAEFWGFPAGVVVCTYYTRATGFTAQPQLITAPTTKDVFIFDGTDYINRRLKQNDIGANFAITAFASNQPALIEVGSTIIDPHFTASYNNTPTNVTIQDNQGTGIVNVTGTPTSFAYTATYTENAYGITVTWSLNATDGTGSDNASDATEWVQLVYWGVGAPGGSTEAFIEALANSALATTRNRTFTVTPSSTQKIYYAYRNAYGTATFTVGGFSGGFNSGTVISVTNAHGFTENYRLYESDNVDLGTTTVVVT